MPLGFAFNVDLRIKKKDGTEVSLTGYRLSPIDKAFIYAILDLPIDFFMDNIQNDFDFEYEAIKFLKNKF